MTSPNQQAADGVLGHTGPSLFGGGYLHVTGAQGNPTDVLYPKLGAGMELFYIRDNAGATDGVGLIQAYNRDTNTWRDVQINARTVALNAQGGTVRATGQFETSGTLNAYGNPGPLTSWFNQHQIQILSDAGFQTGIGFHEQGSSAATLYKAIGAQDTLRIRGNNGANYPLAGMDFTNAGNFYLTGGISFSSVSWIDGPSNVIRLRADGGVQVLNAATSAWVGVSCGGLQTNGGAITAGTITSNGRINADSFRTGAGGRIFFHDNETVYTTLSYPWLDFTNCRLRSPTMGLTGAADKFIMGGGQAEFGTSTLTYQCITATARLSVADNDPHGITFYVNGQAGGTTGWAVNPSTRDSKSNIKPLTNALDLVTNEQLHGVSYEVKTPDKLLPGGVIQPTLPHASAGFIVDDWEALMPTVCTYDDHARLAGMDYTQVIPLVFEALKQYITRTDARLAALENG